MNAPINLALLQLLANAAPAIEQPQVAADMALLKPAHNHDGLYLDLYGVADEDDGCSVEAVTLAGAGIKGADLSQLFSPGQLTKLGWAVDRAGVAARAASRDEGRAERAAWDRAAMA
jgi:hypothetical protein